LPLARLLGYRRLQAGHAVEDVASGGLLRKLGFRPTGEMALVAAGHPAEMGPGLRSTLVRCALDLPALTGLAGDEDREGDDWGGDDWGGDDDLGGAPTRRAA
ncbi:MAG TPA: hypothetical protein VFF94_01765, partial [Novosphingobium sp.]|nr:hypothetical protein [Novosphingobium sp.]